MLFSYIIIDKTYTHESVHVHTIMRQPSPLQHMLGCVAEATLTACLTAASVCYRHGPVSATLSSPPFSSSPLCLPLSSLSYHHFFHAQLALVLPPFWISSSFSGRQNQIWASYYYRAPVYLSLSCFNLLN